MNDVKSRLTLRMIEIGDFDSPKVSLSKRLNFQCVGSSWENFDYYRSLGSNSHTTSLRDVASRATSIAKRMSRDRDAIRGWSTTNKRTPALDRKHDSRFFFFTCASPIAIGFHHRDLASTKILRRTRAPLTRWNFNSPSIGCKSVVSNTEYERKGRKISS